MTVLTLLLILATQEEPPRPIPERIETALAEALAQARARIHEVVQLELKEIRKRRFFADLDEFASKLVDDARHNRLRKLFLSPSVKVLWSSMGIDSLTQLIEMYFAVEEDGRYRLHTPDSLDGILEYAESSGLVDPIRVPHLGLSYVKAHGGGITLTDVEAGGAAAEAGLKREDRIVLLNGKRMMDLNVNEVLNGLAVDTELVYFRG